MTSRGIRNFNPGNIDFNQAQFARDKWVGEVGLEDHPEARFTTFEKPIYGIRAVGKILLTYQRKYGLKTVRGIVNRWAPPVENATASYVEFVSGCMSVDPDEDIDLVRRPAEFMALTAAIIRMENGQVPYSREEIADGLTLALA